MLDLQLDVASYGLMEPVSGASRVVDVYADSLTVVYIVTTVLVAAEVPEEEIEGADDAEVLDTTAFSVQMHVCDPGIQDADALLALGGRAARLAECPVLTLPENYAPDGAVTAGQAWFDIALSGDSGFAASLSSGTFTPDQTCESTLGVQLSTNPYDDACYSTSSYGLDATRETMTLSMTALPDLHRFGYAETGDDVTAVWVVDQSTGIAAAELATAGETALVHVYLFAPPRVTVVQHVCGPEITSPEAVEALGGFMPRNTACPAVSRDTFGFDATIADGWGATHALSSIATEWLEACEADLGFDINGVGNDNACLQFPSYTAVNAGRGAVEVYPAYPDGYQLGGLDFTPGTNDGATLLAIDLVQPVIALDTTFDGNVVLHLYAIPETEEPAQPSATATATATATVTATATAPSTTTPVSTGTATPTVPATGAFGTVQVVALYCLGTQNSTSLRALAPGQPAGQAEIGGQCFGGDAQIQIAFAGEGQGEAIRLGRDGVAWLEEAPVGSSHSIADVVSGKSTTFSVQQGAITRVVLRIDAALGTTSSGSAPENGQPGGTTGVNPLDLLGLLVTDVLVTDVLNIADAGEMSAGSYDANAYAVDLLGGLAVDELASVTADGMPAVGNGERATRASPILVQIAAMISALLLLLGGVWVRQIPRRHGLSRH